MTDDPSLRLQDFAPAATPCGTPADDFFASAAWHSLLFETCRDPGDTVRWATLVDGEGRWLAGLPLRRPARPQHRPGGRELAAFTAPYSTILSPLVRGDAPAGMLDRLAAALIAEARDADHLLLDCLPEGGEWPEAAEAACLRAGWPICRFPHFGNWHRDCQGLHPDAFFQSLPGQLRNTLRRRGRQAAQDHAVSWRLFRETAETAEAAAIYAAVYARSWKTPEPHPRFIPALIDTAARFGALRLGALYFDGTPVAAQIWLVSSGRATIFKLAYDERCKAWSPGSLLTEFMIRRVLEEDRPFEIDFGRGDDGYKKDWLPQRRQRHGLLAFNPRRPGGWLGAARHVWLPRLLGRRSGP